MQKMTPWEAIEEALRRKRPPRGDQWLADQIGSSVQTIGNWKKRRVPPSKYRQISDAIGLSIDQIEGRAPLPWETATAWPFPDVELLRRLESLERDQRIEIQAKLRELVEKFETSKGAALGKAANSTAQINRNGTRS